MNFALCIGWVLLSSASAFAVNAHWHAHWIGGPTNAATIVLRREFGVEPGLRRAVVEVCGLGQYEFSLNGRKVGDDLLTPGWTNYRKTCLYDTYDVTAQLKEGRNVADILLGGGMYNVPDATNRFAKFRGAFGPLKAIAQIRLEYGDHVEFVGTDKDGAPVLGRLPFPASTAVKTTTRVGLRNGSRPRS